MTARRYIGAARNYEVVDGAFRRDPSQMSNVVLRVTTTYGSCLVAPKLGNRARLVKKLGASSLRRIEHFYLECLQDLVQRGDIWDLQVSSTRLDRGGVQTSISFRDATSKSNPETFVDRIGG